MSAVPAPEDGGSTPPQKPIDASELDQAFAKHFPPKGRRERTLEIVSLVSSVVGVLASIVGVVATIVIARFAYKLQASIRHHDEQEKIAANDLDPVIRAHGERAHDRLFADKVAGRPGFASFEKLLFWSTNNANLWREIEDTRNRRSDLGTAYAPTSRTYNPPFSDDPAEERAADDLIATYGDDHLGRGPYVPSIGNGYGETTDRDAAATAYARYNPFHLYYKLPDGTERTPLESRDQEIYRLDIQVGHAYEFDAHWKEMMDLVARIDAGRVPPENEEFEKRRARWLLRESLVVVHPMMWGYGWNHAERFGPTTDPSIAIHKNLPWPTERGLPIGVYEVVDRMNLHIHGTVDGHPAVPPVPRAGIFPKTAAGSDPPTHDEKLMLRLAETEAPHFIARPKPKPTAPAKDVSKPKQNRETNPHKQKQIRRTSRHSAKVSRRH